MLFVYYPKCTTCACAKNWLDDHHIEYTERHNTSGLLYKSLHLKEKLPDMTEDEMYEILSSDGMLIKRPLIITQNKILIGFKEKEWDEYFKTCDHI